MQRFISEDPIGFAGGDVNLQAYVGNSPLNYVDPSGLVDLTPGFVDDAWDAAGDAYDWGTDQAQQSMEYYADLANNSDSPFVDAIAYVGGGLSSLATRKNAAETALTLIPGGIGARVLGKIAIAKHLPLVTVGKIRVHGPHHSFGIFGKRRHIQVNFWIPGRSGSGWNLPRLPLP